MQAANDCGDCHCRTSVRRLFFTPLGWSTRHGFDWHEAVWHKQLSEATGAQGPLLLHGAAMSKLAVGLVQGPATPIKHHQAKAAQLQLLVRQLSRSAHGARCSSPSVSRIWQAGWPFQKSSLRAIS